MTNATDTMPSHKGETCHVVVVNRPAVFTKTGRIHKGSRSAIFRAARRLNPDLRNAGITEVLYGSRKSINTVVVFDTTWTAKAGLQ